MKGHEDKQVHRLRLLGLVDLFLDFIQLSLSICLPLELRIEPRTAGCEARMLTLSNAVFSLGSLNKVLEKGFLGFFFVDIFH